jgi:membrane protease YdiL (CAAX protease family)
MSQPPFPPGPQEFQEISQPHPSAETTPPLSPFVTAALAAILLIGIGFFIWLQVTVPPLERVAIPEVALPWVNSRTLDLDEATARASTWERVVYRATSQTPADELDQAIRWYRELVETTENPTIQLELAILEAERGDLEQVRRRIEGWRAGGGPCPSCADMVEAAYVQPAVDRRAARDLMANAAETVSPGWFSDRIAMRLAAKAGDMDALQAIERRRSDSIMPFLGKIRVLTAVEGAAVVLGLFAIPAMARDRRPISTAPIPPPWPYRLGLLVLIRGGGLAVLLSLATLTVATDDPIIRLWTVPLVSFPVFALAHRRLLQPNGYGLITGLGLWPFPQAWPRTIVAVLAVLAVGVSGEWIIGLVSESFGITSHWTEWFDADLVWGGPEALTITVIEFVVIAPVVEEGVFRGLLFGTLRGRFGWIPAAAISAGLFAAAHGYGAVGFASVFLSGFIWAWIYERTGSLVPGMVAHALNNLLVCVSTIVLLRL